MLRRRCNREAAFRCSSVCCVVVRRFRPSLPSSVRICALLSKMGYPDQLEAYCPTVSQTRGNVTLMIPNLSRSPAKTRQTLALTFSRLAVFVKATKPSISSVPESTRTRPASILSHPVQRVARSKASCSRSFTTSTSFQTSGSLSEMLSSMLGIAGGRTARRMDGMQLHLTTQMRCKVVSLAELCRVAAVEGTRLIRAGFISD